MVLPKKEEEDPQKLQKEVFFLTSQQKLIWKICLALHIFFLIHSENDEEEEPIANGAPKKGRGRPPKAPKEGKYFFT